MGMVLDQVVPWGRSLAEYSDMFALSAADLQRSILDCGGGPASFNAELNRQGASVVSCDPLYQFSAVEIRQRIDATYAVIVQQLEQHQNNYCWTTIRSPQHLGQVRMAAMNIFLDDLAIGLVQQRYVNAAMPTLPFQTNQFELALCSHLLFTYSQQLPLEFHLAAIREMSRVAAEVRIFPLLTLAGEPCPLLPQVITALLTDGLEAEVVAVSYEFQRGGNQMLRVIRMQ